MSIRLPAAARREQLLEAAMEIFAGKGYHETSMNDVALAAGVTKPVLYQHFDSKRDLYVALIEEAGSRLMAAITAPQIIASNGRLRTELGFRAYFEWVRHDDSAFTLLFGGSSRREAEFSEAIERFTSQVADAIEPLITADIDDEHRRTLAHAIVGLAEGVSRRLVRQGSEFDATAVAKQVSDLAWAGLRAAQRS